MVTTSPTLADGQHVMASHMPWQPASRAGERQLHGITQACGSRAHMQHSDGNKAGFNVKQSQVHFLIKKKTGFLKFKSK